MSTWWRLFRFSCLKRPEPVGFGRALGQGRSVGEAENGFLLKVFYAYLGSTWSGVVKAKDAGNSYSLEPSATAPAADSTLFTVLFQSFPLSDTLSAS
jgi:hypothetical protein